MFDWAAASAMVIWTASAATSTHLQCSWHLLLSVNVDVDVNVMWMCG
jgi:hypothetical protein